METCPRQVQHLALNTENYGRYIFILYYYYLLSLLLLLLLLFTLGKSVTDKKVFLMGNSYLSMRKIASVCVLQIKCWCNSKSTAEPTFVIFFLLLFEVFQTMSTRIRTFLKPPKYNFYPDWCGQGLSLFSTGEWFQNNVVLCKGVRTVFGQGGR